MALQRSRTGGRPPVQRRPAFWRARLPGMSSPTRDPRAMVQVATDTRRQVHRLAQTSLDRVADGMGRALSAYFDRVRSAWPQPGNAPTATGHSLRRLGLRMRAAGAVLEVSLVNTADYAAYIRQRRHGNRRAAERVLWTPAEKVATDLARDLADDLARED